MLSEFSVKKTQVEKSKLNTLQATYNGYDMSKKIVDKGAYVAEN